jgi:hypothetical protein
MDVPQATVPDRNVDGKVTQPTGGRRSQRVTGQQRNQPPLQGKALGGAIKPYAAKREPFAERPTDAFFDVREGCPLMPEPSGNPRVAEVAEVAGVAAGEEGAAHVPAEHVPDPVAAKYGHDAG